MANPNVVPVPLVPSRPAPVRRPAQSRRPSSVASLFVAKTAAPLSPIDAAVGANLRGLRALRQMSEAALAAALDMPLDVFREIEKGRRRLDARDLFRASKVLQTSSSAFFAGLIGEMPSAEALAVALCTDVKALDALRTARRAAERAEETRGL